MVYRCAKEEESERAMKRGRERERKRERERTKRERPVRAVASFESWTDRINCALSLVVA